MTIRQPWYRQKSEHWTLDDEVNLELDRDDEAEIQLHASDPDTRRRAASRLLGREAGQA